MKTITLKSNGLGRYDDVSPFIIADGKLELKVNLPVFNGEFFIVADINGTKYKKPIAEDGRITLDGLSAGELRAEIKHYLKGALIKSYTIEPLILREVDCNLSGTPEIIELRQRTDALTEVKNGLLKRLNALNEKFVALLRFAYADYKDNVFLSGGSVDDFLKEFGIELSEEERKEIFIKE